MKMKNKIIEVYIEGVLKEIPKFEGDFKKLLKYVLLQIKKLNQ